MMRPLRDQVLIRLEEVDHETTAIIIPERAKTGDKRGRVEAVGSMVSELRVGDRVLLDVALNAVAPGSLVLVSESEILAVLDAE
jgi:co-chaperonin GroES (HSP10)